MKGAMHAEENILAMTLTAAFFGGVQQKKYAISVIYYQLFSFNIIFIYRR